MEDTLVVNQLLALGRFLTYAATNVMKYFIKINHKFRLKLKPKDYFKYPKFCIDSQPFLAPIYSKFTVDKVDLLGDEYLTRLALETLCTFEI